MKIDIYLASQCRPNPGLGAWAYVILFDGKLAEKKSYLIPNQTNVQMDIVPAILSLEGLIGVNDHIGSDITIYTYSQYLVNGATEWMTNWELKNFKGIKNEKYWKRLNRSINRTNPAFEWIRKSAGNKYIAMGETMCDKMYLEKEQFISGLLK